jgi:uncharacterized membrane protein
MRKVLSLVVFTVILIVGLHGTSVLVHAQKPAPPSDLPVIRVEDALVIADLNTAIVTNDSHMAQLQQAYQQIMAEKQQLQLKMKKAKEDALKHADADPEKYDVEEATHKIIAKPAPPKPADKK